MQRPTQDLRITSVRPLISPAILIDEIPISESASNLVADTRQAITRVIHGLDPRLVVVVGPCSIHDPGAALEYAEKLKVVADRYRSELVMVLTPVLSRKTPPPWPVTATLPMNLSLLLFKMLSPIA